jgi:hypothetical protein
MALRRKKNYELEIKNRKLKLELWHIQSTKFPSNAATNAGRTIKPKYLR